MAREKNNVMSKVCSKFTIKMSERRDLHYFYVFIMNFEQFRETSLVFSILTVFIFWWGFFKIYLNFVDLRKGSSGSASSEIGIEI